MWALYRGVGGGPGGEGVHYLAGHAVVSGTAGVDGGDEVETADAQSEEFSYGLDGYLYACAFVVNAMAQGVGGGGEGDAALNEDLDAEEQGDGRAEVR